MSAVDPCLIRSSGTAGEPLVRLGVPVLDEYLEFMSGRCRPNTVLATAYDLKVFFTVVCPRVLSRYGRRMCADGRREVLGFDVGDSEDGAFWTGVPALAQGPWPHRNPVGHLRCPPGPSAETGHRCLVPNRDIPLR